MPLGLDILTPLAYPGWDDLVEGSGKGSFFHSSYWAKVLNESYGYRPAYFASLKNKGLEVLLPFMEINSPVTGKRGVSLPFTDYCEPIMPDGGDIGDIIGHIIRHGKRSGWRYMEIRSGESLPREFSPSSACYGHELDIAKGEKAIFSSFRESTKRNIRKAEKEGVRVAVCSSLESVKAFYALNCGTRKVHGLPPQPFRFFEAVHRHIVSTGHGVVVLAQYGGTTIAGGIYFNFGDKAIYKFGASDKRHQNLRANNLVMWEAIRHYAAKGCKSLCFGRTEPGNDGLLRFKRAWGTRERAVNYYKYDMKQESYVTELLKVRGLHNKVFANMPVPLLRLTGSLLYSHIG